MNKLLFDFKKLKSRVIGDTFVKVYVDAWKNLTGRILKVGGHGSFDRSFKKSL